MPLGAYKFAISQLTRKFFCRMHVRFAWKGSLNSSISITFTSVLLRIDMFNACIRAKIVISNDAMKGLILIISSKPGLVDRK